MAGEISGYQPNPQAAALVRVRGRGPRSHELRRLSERWSAARAQERERLDELGARHREYVAALAAHDEALADQDEAALDGKPRDAKRVSKLAGRVDDAEKQRDAAARRITAFRPRLIAIEQKARHFAERNADEICAEMIPTLAAAERKFREALSAVQAAAARVDDEVGSISAVQGVLQAGEPVLSGGGDVGALLTLVGRVQGSRLMQLPSSLVALATEAGMVTEFEVGGTPIAANMPHPRGTRSMNDLQSAQARRIDELAEQEALA